MFRFFSTKISIVLTRIFPLIRIGLQWACPTFGKSTSYLLPLIFHRPHGICTQYSQSGKNGRGGCASAVGKKQHFHCSSMSRREKRCEVRFCVRYHKYRLAYLSSKSIRILHEVSAWSFFFFKFTVQLSDKFKCTYSESLCQLER